MSSLFFLLLFLHFLNSSTMLSAASIDIKGSRLPLLVFQQHHHHSINYYKHIEDGLLDDITTLNTPAMDYYAYNAATDPVPTSKKHIDKGLRILYQIGESEKDLPICPARAVCSKVDVYESPWVEKQCRCPGHHPCSNNLLSNDGHTITDKTRHYKLCEPVKRLPRCKYFRDITWTLTSGPGNTTQQVIHCHCPKGAVAYLIKRQAYQTKDGIIGYQYSFACSPQSRLRCQRKEPCRLFTVRKRLELLDEVNTNTLCQCPHNHYCPRHHTDPGVIQGKSYVEENIRTYSGYCLQ
ncbi:protein argos [Lycorma delicatula]|uniref:protein argos n=1 Tax=Lycorma delicatula TaxID=130591 RepID=UPI003F511688